MFSGLCVFQAAGDFCSFGCLAFSFLVWLPAVFLSFWLGFLASKLPGAPGLSCRLTVMAGEWEMEMAQTQSACEC